MWYATRNVVASVTVNQAEGKTMAKAKAKPGPKPKAIQVDKGAVYSVQSAARLLSVHERTVLRAIKAGDLPAHRPTQRRAFVKGSDLWAWVTGEPKA